MIDLDQIDRFPVIRCLGNGGMGDVYWARDPRLDREVAIKVIAPDFLEDEGVAKLYCRRFHNEATIGARLSHEHIASVYETGEIEGSPYIVMEYVPGPSLSTLIKRRHCFTNVELPHIICQLCDALDHAHHVGVVHRDLKPGNIIISPEKGVKILDFGIAKLITDDRLYMGSEGDCTPDFASPEQLNGEETDRRSDIFSLGLIIHLLIAGSMPHSHERQAPRGTAINGCPAVYYPVFWKALHPDTEQRYQTAGAFGAAALEAFQMVGVTRFCFDAVGADWANPPAPIPIPMATHGQAPLKARRDNRLLVIKLVFAVALFLLLGKALLDNGANPKLGNFQGDIAVHIVNRENRLDSVLTSAFQDSIRASGRYVRKVPLFNSSQKFAQIWANPENARHMISTESSGYLILGKAHAGISKGRFDKRVIQSQATIVFKIIDLGSATLICSRSISANGSGFSEMKAIGDAYTRIHNQFNDNELKMLPKTQSKEQP